MARFKDTNWCVATADNPRHAKDCAEARLAVLMDLRDELKENNQLLGRLVRVLECSNTTQIPAILRRISRNTAKPRKRKARS